MVAAYHGHTEIVRAIFKHSIASVHMQDEVRVLSLFLQFLFRLSLPFAMKLNSKCKYVPVIFSFI